MFYSAKYASPLGAMTLASDGEHLIGLWFDGQKYFMNTLTEPPVERVDLSIFAQTKRWLDRYFAGEKPAPSELPLAPIGGEFRKLIWRYLCEIPYGDVTTYGSLAAKVAATLGRQTMSAQAVGGAVGHNPISIIIPCHRVVGTDRSLTGYAGGIDKKIELLQLEGVDVTNFFEPKKGRAR